MRTSPTSNHTARIGTGTAPSGSGERGELLVEDADRGRSLPAVHGGAELAQAAGAGGVAGLVQPVGGVAGQTASSVQLAGVQFSGSRTSELRCRGRTTVKCRQSRVATSATPSRSATAMTAASVVPSGRSEYLVTRSAIRA
jgi:hypothetical protein